MKKALFFSVGVNGPQSMWERRVFPPHVLTLGDARGGNVGGGDLLTQQHQYHYGSQAPAWWRYLLLI